MSEDEGGGEVGETGVIFICACAKPPMNRVNANRAKNLKRAVFFMMLGFVVVLFGNNRHFF